MISLAYLVREDYCNEIERRKHKACIPVLAYAFKRKLSWSPFLC